MQSNARLYHFESASNRKIGCKNYQTHYHAMWYLRPLRSSFTWYKTHSWRSWQETRRSGENKKDDSKYILLAHLISGRYIPFTFESQRGWVRRPEALWSMRIITTNLAMLAAWHRLILSALGDLWLRWGTDADIVELMYGFSLTVQSPNSCDSENFAIHILGQILHRVSGF